jgi:hypothetical protein
MLVRGRRKLVGAKIAMTAILAAALAGGAAAVPPGPQPQTLAAFDSYVAQAEAHIRQQESAPETFLGMDASPVKGAEGLGARLRRGEIVVTSGGFTPVEVPGGLIHHWIGIVFIPQATIAQVFEVLQNYDDMAQYYSPDVAASRLIKRHGDNFQVSIRLRDHEIVTVTLDGLYDVKYGRLDATHQFSVSHSMQMVEVGDAAKSDEDTPADARDHGFLWRTNAYWRFEQAGDGVFVEFESISLSRDVPAGWGWMIEPFIREIPRESLVFTLRATRRAVLANDASVEPQIEPLRHRP